MMAHRVARLRHAFGLSQTTAEALAVLIYGGEGAGLLQLVGKHRAGSHCQTFTLLRLRPGLSDAENILTLPSPEKHRGAEKGGEGLRLHMTRKSDRHGARIKQ